MPKVIFLEVISVWFCLFAEETIGNGEERESDDCDTEARTEDSVGRQKHQHVII